MSNQLSKPKRSNSRGFIPLFPLIAGGILGFVLLLVFFVFSMFGSRGDAATFGLAGGFGGFNCRGGLKANVSIAGYKMSESTRQIFIYAGQKTGVPPAYLAAQARQEAGGYLNGSIWTDDVVRKYSYLNGKQQLQLMPDNSGSSSKPGQCVVNYIGATGPMQLDQWDGHTYKGNFDPTRLKMFKQIYGFDFPVHGECYLDTAVFYAATMAKYQQERYGFDLSTADGRFKAWGGDRKRGYGTSTHDPVGVGAVLERWFKVAQDTSSPDCQEAKAVSSQPPGAIGSGDVSSIAASLQKDSNGLVRLPDNPTLYSHNSNNQGLPNTIASIIYTAQLWHNLGPNHPPFRIGDINQGPGGRHYSHRQGADVDIYIDSVILKSGNGPPPDQSGTQQLADVFWQTGNLKCIGYNWESLKSYMTKRYGLSNQTGYSGPYIRTHNDGSSWGGHNNHFHVRFKGTNQGC